MDIRDLGEFELIDRIRESLTVNAESPVMGIGDDCAIIPKDDDFETLVTTDMLVEGVHFDLNQCNPCQLGYKALAVNLSDIAAMGGIPRHILISLAIPDYISVEFIDQFYAGLKELSERFVVQIVGGDTTHSISGLIINIALLGEIEKGRYLCRSGAQIGDLICVTGFLGNSSAGLHLLTNYPAELSEFEELAESYRMPYPHVKPGRIMADSGLVHSLIDISDGLASDLKHICKTSGMGAEIYEEMLPVSSSLVRYAKKHDLDYLKYALGGGEDYCLLLTVATDNFSELAESINEAGYDLHNFGEITDSGMIQIIRSDGSREDLKIKGWDHFNK